jgi:hypothetical protein
MSLAMDQAMSALIYCRSRDPGELANFLFS